MSKKALELATLSPVGEPGGGSYSGSFEREKEEGSGDRASCIKLIWASLLCM